MSTLLDHVQNSWALLIFVFVVLIYCIKLYQCNDDLYSKFIRIKTESWRLPFSESPVHELVHRGYHEIIRPTGKPFVIRWWASDFMVMPARYLADLRGADWHHLSFFSNISDAFHLHTTVGDMYKSTRMVEVVTSFLSPQLPVLSSQVIPGAVDLALEREIGRHVSDEEWTPLLAAKTLGAITHRVATRVLISEEMMQNDDFVRASHDFVNSIFFNALVIMKLPLGPFRGLLAIPFHSAIGTSSAKRPLSCCQVFESEWTITAPDYIAAELLHGLWAGSAAPGGSFTEILFQLLLTPEYTAPLREEAKSATREYGWSEQTFGALILMDSFIREINRLYSTGSIAASRTVQGRPFTFSDGLTLPVGTRFGFPMKALQSDLTTYSDKDDFNGFRHARREEFIDRQERRLKSHTADMTNLAFGYGNHTCPGRFFATREVKIILTKILLQYDLKWDRGSNGRLSPLLIEGQFAPNMSQQIWFRRRKQPARLT